MVVIDDPLSPAEVITDEAADELDKGLSVAQNFRLEPGAENGEGDKEYYDRRHPSGQKDRNDDVEAFKPIVPGFLQEVSQWHTAG